MKPGSLLIPIDPFRGFRGIDAWGAGGFGAPRGDRTHPGVDLIAEPGDAVRTPGACRVDRIGNAYKDSHLRFVHLSAPDWHARILYVAPAWGLKLNTDLEAGEQIGAAQDVAAYYKTLDPKREMVNHIHFEMFLLADPTPLLQLPEPT